MADPVGPARFRRAPLPGRAWAAASDPMLSSHDRGDGTPDANGRHPLDTSSWGMQPAGGAAPLLAAAPGAAEADPATAAWQRGPAANVFVDGQPQYDDAPAAANGQYRAEQLYVPSVAHQGSNGALHRQLGAVMAQHAQYDSPTPSAYSSGDEEKGGGKARGCGGAARPGTPSTPNTLRRNSRLALLSMLLLVFQGTALSIMLRYSRARAGAPYLASVSVIFTETIKLVICLVMQFRAVAASADAYAGPGGPGSGKPGGGGGGALGRELRRQARDIVLKSLPMLLPAGMFVMQQVLLVIAASHLDAMAFQIFSQSFKLVPTALFAYWLLGQMLEPVQWASIPVLALGVILVTVNNGGGGGAKMSAAAAAGSSSSHGLDYVAGMVACSVTGLSSAYAGVYFEKYVKGRHAASLWVRNIQLGIYGVPLSAGYALLKDGGRIWRGGLLQGFDAATWTVIALQVFGGLVTGMVVKYCDNILKNFALAVSVILTVLVAIPLFGQWPSPIFLLGVALVLLSVFMYGRALDARRLQLQWQKARRRFAAAPARTHRLALFGLLGGCVLVLLVTGALTSRHAAGTQPLTQGGGIQSGHLGGGAAHAAGASGRRAAVATAGAKAGGDSGDGHGAAAAATAARQAAAKAAVAAATAAKASRAMQQQVGTKQFKQGSRRDASAAQQKQRQHLQLDGPHVERS